MTYRLSNGAIVNLGSQVGNRGGEGTAYQTINNPNIIAKIYHPSKASDRAKKLQAMVKANLYSKMSFGSFPIDIISEGNKISGFTMDRITNANPIHMLWNSRDRMQNFPNADFRFITRVASNLSQNFARLHSEGIVIGDVNESGIWVSKQGYVRFIDCDSFQFTYQGRTYPCLVHVDEYAPPELLINKKSRNNRTPNHDNFALAVMIFRLLMAGQHPFNAKYLGTGESPTRAALISSFVYPYSQTALRSQFEPPPHAPKLDVLSPKLQTAFEAAFARSGAIDRPSADTWAALLQKYDEGLRTCSRNSNHLHPSSAGSCPWCELEARRGVNLFPSSSTRPHTTPPSRQYPTQQTPAPHKQTRRPARLILFAAAVMLGLGLFALQQQRVASEANDQAAQARLDQQIAAQRLKNEREARAEAERQRQAALDAQREAQAEAERQRQAALDTQREAQAEIDRLRTQQILPPPNDSQIGKIENQTSLIPGRIGVQVVDFEVVKNSTSLKNSTSPTNDGIVVIDIVKNGPAFQYLSYGDVIYHANGKPVKSISDFISSIKDLKSGDRARIYYNRNGENYYVDIPISRDAALFHGDAEVVGMTYTPITDNIRKFHGLSKEDSGLIVNSVNENSESQKSGVKVGDIIIEVNFIKIETAANLRSIVEATKKSGRTSILLLVKSSGEGRFIQIPIVK